MPEDNIPGSVPLRRSRTSPLISAGLPPTVFWRRQVMMAGKTIQLSEFRPRLSRCAAAQPLESLTQLHRLPNSPLLHASPGIAFRRKFPMTWHHCAERIQLESKVGMSRRNHLVIHSLLRRTDVATHAFFRARQQIPRLVLPQLYRLLSRPASRGVRAQPTHRRTVAVFAT